jgi:hypothetical protein
MQMNCWKCGAKLEESSLGKISFRAICEKCHSWLHCCKNCVNYKPGLPNDCYIPGTEFISDREASNFCEEFKILGVFAGIKDGEAAKKKFNSLFAD